MVLRVIGPLHKPKLDGDVGYDIPTCVRRSRQSWLDRVLSRFLREPVHVILPLQTRSFASGVRCALPFGVWMQIRERSSARHKKLLFVGGGVIDDGYRGELFAVLYNYGFLPRVLREGERYTQAVLHRAVVPSIRYVEEFHDATDRGAAGFGSTGR